MSEPGYHAENHPRHVDRKALYTDLEARIDYLQRFLDFNAGWCPPASPVFPTRLFIFIQYFSAEVDSPRQQRT